MFWKGSVDAGFSDKHLQVHCGAQGAVLVELYREAGDMLGLGLARSAKTQLSRQHFQLYEILGAQTHKPSS